MNTAAYTLKAIRRRQAQRTNARARAKFFRELGAWVGMVALVLIAIPCAGALGWLLAAGVNL